MPIVVCPGCGAKLNAPDAAAGKRVKCPKPDCGTVIAVPAPTPLPAASVEELPPEPLPEPPAPPPAPPQSNPFDFDNDEPKPSKKPARKAEPDEDEDEDRPAKKKRAAAEDEEDSRPKKKRRAVDDDDDEDNRPTRRRKQAASGLSPVVIGAIALGGLLVLGGVGYGIYALTKKSDDTASSGSGGSGGSGSSAPEKPKGKVPEKWVEYKSTQDKFKMTMPKPVKKNSDGQGNRYEAIDVGNFLMAMVYVLDVPPGLSPELRKEMEDKMVSAIFDKKGEKLDRRRVSFKGKMVDEIMMDIPLDAKDKEEGLDFKPRMQIRIVPTETKIYFVCVAALKEPEQLKDAEAIFDTFQVLK